MRNSSHWKVPAFGLAAMALSLVASPDAQARPEDRVAAIDPIARLTPAAAPQTIAPDATPGVALPRRQSGLAAPVQVARVNATRSDAALDVDVTRIEAPVPGALALFASGLLILAVANLRRPRRARA